MKFGPVPIDRAAGAIAAHSIRSGGLTIKKGTWIEARHIEAMRAEGLEEVVVARLEPRDVHEDEAAARVARLVAGPHVRVEKAATGRANLFAEAAGLLVLDRARIDALNRIDPGLTFATLPAYGPAEAGRMVATVKIIPFAIPGAALDKAEALLRGEPEPLIRIAPYRALKVGVVATRLPGLKESILDKTRRILDKRLAPAGAQVVGELRVPHDASAIADAMARLSAEGAELVLVYGASAITDEDDVIPAAIRQAGGRIVHLGMPVDPGNLLLVGDLGGRPVIGAPGCARSPSENGFDWVLNRFLAGLEVTFEDITGMGVGGLLMDVVTRPQPREPVAAEGPVAAVILAAGRSRRMGGPNKLLATFAGEPLVRRMAEAALASRADPVIVVTGHMREAVEAALAGLGVRFVHNADYAEGLSASLRTGIAAVPEDRSGALVTLADMPGITPGILNALIDAFDPREDRAIVVPTAAGKRGNPVLWARAFFPELTRLTGDTGARHLIETHADAVHRLEVGEAIAIDVDTPQALAAAGGELPRES
ncbi:MAG TPA: molybdopterin-binding/glycosyltransferase family 2 protein [Afifellaceae bacterium]|nr:molybdopterin-binding/glycosyltransferase family 2 protein [Afifellaceae bacterium]